MEINKNSLADSMKEYELKDKEYYKGINWQLFDLIEPHAKTILEVGCAEGLFGAAVKEKRIAPIMGSSLIHQLPKKQHIILTK